MFIELACCLSVFCLFVLGVFLYKPCYKEIINYTYINKARYCHLVHVQVLVCKMKICPAFVCSLILYSFLFFSFCFVFNN